MNLFLLIGVWIMALCFFIGGVTKLRTSEADYQEVQIQYEMVYLTKYGRTSLMIVLENKKDAYHLYPQYLPNNIEIRQALKALEKSSTATVWYEENGWIRGIKTAHLSILPSHGVKVEHEDGKVALWFSAFWFIAGIGFYLYMKWYYKEDWMEGSAAPKYQTFGTETQNKNDEFIKLNLAQDRNVSTTPPPSNHDEIIKLNLK